MKKVLLGAAAVLGAATLAALLLLREGGPVDVNVPAGLSAGETARLLEEKGVVRSRRLFRFVAVRTGADRKLKPGAYKLRENMWLPNLLAQLQQGGVTGQKIVVPEGFAAVQIAERLEAEGVCKADPFLRAVTAQRLEGFLFPTTYFFEPNTPADKVAARMREEFKKRAEPEIEASKGREGRPNLSLLQIVTLASIVEREAVLAQERPMIASVYLNRMRIRMRLEADPTTQYSVQTRALPWKKNLTRGDLKNPSPYNTYVHYGLPPGPICSPGLDSIRAALAPAKSDALYFVADATGGHTFSATHDEHLKAKRTFKRALRILKQQAKDDAQKRPASTP